LSEVFLVLKEQIVHLPEFAETSGKLGNLGRGLSLGVNLRQGKVAENEAKLLSELRLDLFHQRMGLATVGALVVAVLDECARSLGIALNVILASDLNL
jgi:hypothetical protein